MTILQEQLAAIAASTTNQIDLKAQKRAHSRSLLFEPEVAAVQDFDVIYHICIEGFEELRSIDARFSVFANTIFSEQSKEEERAQLNAKENLELDTILRRFLLLVGGQILLKPAIKAIEWLVRRFRHVYIYLFIMV